MDKNMRILRYILASPLILAMLLFDITKLPIVLFFIAPIFLLMDVIDMTKGEDSIFFETLWDVSTIGCQMIHEILED